MTPREVAAALKAAMLAGVKVRRIEVRKDAVVIIPGEPEPPDDTGENPELAEALERVKNVKI